MRIIKVPGASTQSNQGLKKVAQENLTGFEELVKVNTTGITASEKAMGVGCGLKTTSTTGELKGVEFKVKGQKQT